MKKYIFIYKNLKLIIILSSLLLVYFFITKYSLAVPESDNFRLDAYGFGAGGVATSSSESFMFQGILGEVETASLSSTNFIAGPGLTYTLEPNTPSAPAVTNTANFYNKLHVVINNGGNPSDTTFIIQISSGSATFSENVYYVQSNNTLGLDKYWQSYTLWGDSSGFDLIGLYPNTTYYVRVAAKRGTYQQGQYSAVGSAATVSPTFTFNIETTSQVSPPYSVYIGSLTPGSVTTSSDKITANISTNSTNGGLIYVYGTNSGLKSTYAGNYNISSVTNNLTSISEGYGARGTTTTQVSGGPMQLIAPYDGSGNNVGVLDTIERQIANSSNQPVVNGEVSFELKAKASTTTPSATDYTDILTVIGTGAF